MLRNALVLASLSIASAQWSDFSDLDSDFDDLANAFDGFTFDSGSGNRNSDSNTIRFRDAYVFVAPVGRDGLVEYCDGDDWQRHASGSWENY